jgi:DnaJ-class molecular chaperone
MEAHKILGIKVSATKKEIKSAYRKLSLKFHPDNPEINSSEKFLKIKEAYDYINSDKPKNFIDLFQGDDSYVYAIGSSLLKNKYILKLELHNIEKIKDQQGGFWSVRAYQRKNVNLTFTRKYLRDRNYVVKLHFYNWENINVISRSYRVKKKHIIKDYLFNLLTRTKY